MKKRILLLFIGVLFSFLGFGQAFKFLPDVYSQRVNSARMANLGATSTYYFLMNRTEHDKWNDIVSAGMVPSNQMYKSLMGLVKVGINHDTPVVVNAYKYAVTVDIHQYTIASPTTPASIVTKVLYISYNPDSLQEYDDLSVYKFNSYHSFQVKIVQVDDVSSGTPVKVNREDIARNFYVESQLAVQRYDLDAVYIFPQSASDGKNLHISWDLVSTAVSGCSSPSIGGYRNDHKPISYELEWTYIEDYQYNLSGGTSGFAYPTAATINFDFRKNSTRVQLDQREFNIPLVYEHGVIVYRIRAVRPSSASGFKDVVYYAWNLPDYGSISTSSSCLDRSAYIVSSHGADNLNWQYTVNFAEQGKYKHVVNYFDGALKSRQTQTKINTDNNYIIAVDKVMDYEGRPSIVSLPTPVQQEALGYRNDLLLNYATNLPYKASDFDQLGCSVPEPIEKLANSAAANIYYSPLNPDKAGMQQFVPDAEGYPFIQTIYSPDNTNKVEMQGGAGKEMQLWQNRGTRYDYVRASQPELDLLLGTEAGKQSFYPKQIVTDPNGQSSLTIMNQKGQVVISALVGPAPDDGAVAIDTITNYKRGKSLCSDVLENVQQERTANSVEFYTTYYNETDGSNSLEYTVNLKPWPTGCDGKYLWAKGRFEVAVSNDCGVPVDALYLKDSIGSYDQVTVDDPATVHPSVHTTTLPKGKYAVNKKIWFSPQEIRSRVEEFILANQPNCYFPESYFIKQSIESTEFPCESEAGETGCDVRRSEMIRELYPGAKYGLYEKDETGAFAWEMPNSIFSIVASEVNIPSGSVLAYQDGGTDQCAVVGCATTKTCKDGTIGCGCATGAHKYPAVCCNHCLYSHCKCIKFPVAMSSTTTYTTETKYLPCTINYATESAPLNSFSHDGGYVYLTETWTATCSCGEEHSRETVLKGPFNWELWDIFHPSIFSTLVSSYDYVKGNHWCDQSVNVPTSTVVSYSPAVNISYRYQADCINYPTISYNGVTYLSSDIKKLSPEKFIEIFNEDIAAALLPLHPEYCKLAICGDGDFEEKIERIQTFEEAEEQGLATLEDMVDADPITDLDPYFAPYCLTYPFPVAFHGGDSSGKKLNKLAIAAAYCEAGSKEQSSLCRTGLYKDEIDNMLLVDDEVKQKYFDVLKAMYLGNRAQLKQVFFEYNDGACTPCGYYRMELSGDPVHRNGTVDAMMLDRPDLPEWMQAIFAKGVSGDDDITTPSELSDMVDDNKADEIERQADYVMAQLKNCNVSATVLNNFRTALIADLAGGGSFEPIRIKNLMIAQGIALNDLCHPYLAGYEPLTSEVEKVDYVCGSSALYSGLKSFLQRSDVSSVIKTATTIPPYASSSPFTLNTSNPFENKIADYYGTTSVTVMSLPQSVGTCTGCVLKLMIEPGISFTGPKVELYVLSDKPDIRPTVTDMYNNLLAYVDNAFCLNEDPNASNQGYMSKYTAVMDMKITGSYAIPYYRYYVWSNVIDFMTTATSSAALANAITCLDLKKALQQFHSDQSIYNFDDHTNHPLFEKTLTNYLNATFQKKYSFSDYYKLMHGCGISHQVEMKRYAASYKLELANDAAVAGIVNQINSFGSYSPDYMRYKPCPDCGPVLLYDFNSLGIDTLLAYKKLLDGDFGGTISSCSCVVSRSYNYHLPGDSSFILTSSDCTFSPSYFATAYQTRDGKVWEGSEYANCKVHTFKYNGSSPGANSEAQLVYDIRTSMPSYSYADKCMSRYDFFTHELYRSEDYTTPLKQQYLTYIYGLGTSTTHANIIASVDPAVLPGNLSSYSTKTFSYESPYCQGQRRDVYAYDENPSLPPGNFTLVKTTILNTVVTAPSGKLFPTDKFKYVNYGSVTGNRLAVIQKANGDYWYRYFDVYNNLYNIYITPPDIPGFSPSSWNLSSVIMGQHPNTFYVNVSASGFTGTVKCSGYADFVVTSGVRAKNVILDDETEKMYCWDSLDCEHDALVAAIASGKAAYKQYFEETATTMSKSMMQYMVNNVQEELELCARQQQYQYTLYYYDRANNLTRTVPPRGVVGVGTGLLASIKTRRDDPDADDNSVKYTTHNKISSYRYNALNMPVYENTPDGGITYSFYDAAMRKVFSQNSKQRPGGLYTYILYDKQGRPIETGQVKLGCTQSAPSGIFDTTYCNFYLRDGTPYNSMHPDYVTHAYDELNYPMDTLIKYVRTKPRTDVVVTTYDTMTKDLGAISGQHLSTQENLRKRVSAIRYFPAVSAFMPSSLNAWPEAQFGTYYSYDLNGNVKTITYDYLPLITIGQRYKRVDYDYDLVSGKVNMVSYNRNRADQFYHLYEYDADNRITKASTSNDGIIWNEDARYSYYKHGPLAQARLGDLKIQSLEYAYTIQGWLKSINGDILKPDADMGGNGTSGDYTYARDALAHALHYFEDDYKQIGSATVTKLPEPSTNLYNGNIVQQTTSIRGLSNMQRNYRYDQLNRLKLASNSDVNEYTLALTPSDLYKSTYTYDEDGNILSLLRKDATGTDIDNFTYTYSGSAYAGNRLQRVTDAAAATSSQDLQPGQTGDNYKYDAIGNLVKDEQAHLKMDWNLYGKVKSIKDTLADGAYYRFDYDGMGNRIFKEEIKKTGTSTEYHLGEYYVRDAGGNILAVYRKGSSYAPLDLFTGINTAIGIGGGDIKTVLTLPEMKRGSFPTYAMGKILSEDPTWVTTYIDKPISFYLNNDGEIKNRMLYGSTDWLNDLRTYDIANGERTWRSALLESWSDAAPLFSSALGFVTEGRELLRLFDARMPPSVTQSLWSQYGATHMGNSVINSINLYNQVLGNTGLQQSLADDMMSLINDDHDTGAAYASVFYDSLVADSILFKAPALRGQSGDWTATLTNIMNSFGDVTSLGVFFDQWGPAQTVLEEQTTPDYRLNVVYLSDPDVTISSIVDALSPASVAEVLRDMPDLTTGEYSDLVTKTFGSTVDLSGLAELAIDTVNLAEHHIYGSSRLGVQRYADGQYRNTYGAGTPETTLNAPKPWYHYEYADLIEAGEKDFYASTADGDVSNFSMSRRLGKRYYELTDHLGNVMSTALDRKTGYVPGMGSTSYSYYNPDLAQVSDYYPGGMLMPGRFKEYSWSRMGSQGQQKDDEVYGKGNMYAFKYRMNDTRINRFWSPDPLHGKYPYNSDYAFSENRLTDAVELEGLEATTMMGIGIHYEAELQIANAVKTAHQTGMQNVNVGITARNEAIRQGRTDGDGITTAKLALVYLAPFWNIAAPLSDANDGAVLMTGQNLDGSNATNVDKAFAVIGATVPFISGSSIKNIFEIPSKYLNVSPYSFKHVAPKLPWSSVVKSTLNGPAKFARDINVEQLTMQAWDAGTAVNNGKPWKVYKSDKVIGASSGQETMFVRVELTQSTGELHASPITEGQYKKLTKEKE